FKEDFSKSKTSGSSFSGGSSYKKATQQQSCESLYVGLEEEVPFHPIKEIEVEAEQLLGSLFEENTSENQEETTVKTYQIHRKYIISPIKSGFIVIYQQRAHERILYEEFLKNITVLKSMTQKLLFPIEINYSQYEIALFKELKASLEQIGFEFEAIEKEKIILSGLPINVSEIEANKVFEQLIFDLKEGIPESSFSLNDSIAKSLAKRLSVKTETLLTEKEQSNIIDSLFTCKEPDVSPLRKTAFITMNLDELDKRF